jgi:hypothetical protein
MAFAVFEVAFKVGGAAAAADHAGMGADAVVHGRQEVARLELERREGLAVGSDLSMAQTSGIGRHPFAFTSLEMEILNPSGSTTAKSRVPQG